MNGGVGISYASTSYFGDEGPCGRAIKECEPVLSWRVEKISKIHGEESKRICAGRFLAFILTAHEVHFGLLKVSAFILPNLGLKSSDELAKVSGLACTTKRILSLEGQAKNFGSMFSYLE